MIPAHAIRECLDTARAHLDDLQSEIEAGARCADRIHDGARTIDSRMLTALQSAARLEALRDCVTELRGSIAEQRTILRGLRTSVNQLRQSLRGRR